jgi:hypothetical protein
VYCAGRRMRLMNRGVFDALSRPRALPAVGVVIGLCRAGLDVKPIGVGQPAGAVDTSVVAALAQTSALPGMLRTAMSLSCTCSRGLWQEHRSGQLKDHSTGQLRRWWHVVHLLVS